MNPDLYVEARANDSGHDAGHEPKGSVPEASSGIAARGEARLFSRSAERSNHESGVSRPRVEDRKRQGSRVGMDRLNKPKPRVGRATERRA
jgi:hypothetical protein